MRLEAIIAIGAAAFVVVLFGASLWLANAPMKPQTETTHLAVPDDRIPH